MCSSDSGLLGNALRRIVRAATHPARRDRDGRVVVLFRFVGPNMGAAEQNAGSIAARRLALGEAFATYVGQQFEAICAQ